MRHIFTTSDAATVTHAESILHMAMAAGGTDINVKITAHDTSLRGFIRRMLGLNTTITVITSNETIPTAKAI